jgi:hypothetical protein
MGRTSLSRVPPRLPVFRVSRVLLAALFALLLVGMQREALLHEVDHLRVQVGRGEHAALETSSPGLCVECALLASGANPVPPGDAAVRLSIPHASPPVAGFVTALAASRPAFYQSRAPPRLV